MFPVRVTPDMNMYNLLKSQGYEPAYALAEFIDNALQAYLSDIEAEETRKPLEVSLRFYSQNFAEESIRNCISISDNGSGITRERLAEAMQPARRPASNKGLSEFGIGMKAAAVWFSDKWSLTTKPFNEPTEYQLEFCLDELLAQQSTSINVTETNSINACGTKIFLNNLRRPISKELFNLICTDLRELYQKFTSSDSPCLILNAYFDNQLSPLSFKKDYHILNVPVFKVIKGDLCSVGESKEWKIDISMNFQGINISGFMCLWQTGSYPKNPGLVMLRYGRVIQGLSSKKFMPKSIYKTLNKHAAQRVYGELKADGLPVTYTKDKFEVDQEAFALELKKQTGVEELLKQASTYRLSGFEHIPSGSDTESPPPAAPMTGSDTENPPPSAPMAGSDTENPPPAAPMAGSDTENPPPAAPMTGSDTENPPPAAPMIEPDTESPPSTDPEKLFGENGKNRRELIKPTILKREFQTTPYCENLIEQINWIFGKKKIFKEIVIVALRNLLENHLDFTYGEAFPAGTHTKFDDKLNAMLDLVRDPTCDLKPFVDHIRSSLNQTSRGFQTQTNLYKVLFSKEAISPLIGALHLSAHKGDNIVSLEFFVSTYEKQYNTLLEILHCVAMYRKTTPSNSQSV